MMLEKNRSKPKLSTFFIAIGVLAWVPYGVGTYLLQMELPMIPFLVVHLFGIVPGSLLKRSGL